MLDVMGYNANFSKAVFQREVTGKMLVDYMEQIIGKPEEETQRLLNLFAKEIEAMCPYKEGVESKAAGIR